ncbi:MAG TPA: UDP-N-acetylglucosamine 2-epimerase (non-hydrolyzing) [Candidatus Paceibacterota bacterium]|nr:UDP-N-acetylglucosamine 2-epimerase (non-hydrolyzing) [Candidatus Paceibacterota bacterium]
MKKVKIACIFGTRPELIKMAPIIQMLGESPEFEVVSISTGQHRELLTPLLEWFGLHVHHSMDVMRADQGLNELAGRLMTEFGKLFKQSSYDYVIGQGDTTSVVAAAWAAFHEKIPFLHVEAGLRTFDRNLPFPEEMNRVIVSRLASLHFAPTEASAKNLLVEGVPEEQIFMIGNTVIDALQFTASKVASDLQKIDNGRRMIFMTAHRRENFGEPLMRICTAVRAIVNLFPDVDVVFPVHPNPNVRNVVHAALGDLPSVSLIDPVPYNELINYLMRSYFVLTDSGGLQEEAPALNKPVLVLREETERPELVSLGGSLLVGSDTERIVSEASKLLTDPAHYHKMVLGYSPYGDGNAAERLKVHLHQHVVAQVVE